VRRRKQGANATRERVIAKSIYGFFVEKFSSAQRVPLRLSEPINGHVKPAQEQANFPQRWGKKQA
jgi:hypothetical protein